jgi:hypothetical protein
MNIPRVLLLKLSLAGLPACDLSSNEGPLESETMTGDTGWAVPLTHSTAVITTVSGDFSVGSFAALTLEDRVISDNLFVTSGDPAVAVSSGGIFQFNRYTHDTLRMYRPGRWVTPVWEQELGDRSNPHDAQVCGGQLFVSLYGRDHLGVYALSDGVQTGTVDLSAYADGDGVGPEASTLVVHDGKLYAGLQRLMRHEEWKDAGGWVVEIDCDTLEVSRDWDVGANVTLFPWPLSGKILMGVRTYGEDSAGLYALDPLDGSVHLKVATPETQISGLAAYGDRAVAIALAQDQSLHEILCIDLSNATSSLIERTSRYLTDIAGNDRGEAWIAASPSWVDPSAPTGLSIYDIASCNLTTPQPIGLSLHPVSIAFY